MHLMLHLLSTRWAIIFNTRPEAAEKENMAKVLRLILPKGVVIPNFVFSGFFIHKFA